MQQNQLFIKAMLYNFAGVNGPEAGGAEAGEQQEPEEQRGAGMPDDLYTGAVQAADAMQAAGAKCSPVDAEKVGEASEVFGLTMQSKATVYQF